MVDTDVRVSAFFEAIPQLMWTADSIGQVNYVNSRCREYSGTDAGEKAADGWVRALHPDDAGLVFEKWRAAVQSSGVFEAEYRLRRHDGVYLWFLGRAITFRDEAGQFGGWIGTATDIDERKKLEEMRAALLREAEDAIHARDEFLAIASHELKTPFTALLLQIQLVSQLIERSKVASPDISSVLESARSQCNRLVMLIETLLDVTRIRMGGLVLNRQPFNLAALVRDVTARFALQLSVDGASISVDSPDELHGSWDSIQLEQVLNNLLSNALKFGEGKPVRVTLGTEQGSGLIRLSVSDQGVGIAAAAVPTLFERFKKVFPQSRLSGGLGLGLYICNEIVRAHGGTVSVKSGVDKGTAFVVDLPK